MPSLDQLLQEFELLYANPPRIVGNPKLIVVLSEADLRSPENISRVNYGAKLFTELNGSALLVLNGETEQLDTLVELAKEAGAEGESVLRLDCGRMGVANTLDQFKVLLKDGRVNDKLDDCVLVTGLYHIPRTLLTAGKWLPPDINFSVVGDPDDWKVQNSFLKVMSEIPRIIKYSAKGDILEFPRQRVEVPAAA